MENLHQATMAPKKPWLTPEIIMISKGNVEGSQNNPSIREGTAHQVTITSIGKTFVLNASNARVFTGTIKQAHS